MLGIELWSAALQSIASTHLYCGIRLDSSFLEIFILIWLMFYLLIAGPVAKSSLLRLPQGFENGHILLPP